MQQIYKRTPLSKRDLKNFFAPFFNVSENVMKLSKKGFSTLFEVFIVCSYWVGVDFYG